MSYAGNLMIPIKMKTKTNFCNLSSVILLFHLFLFEIPVWFSDFLMKFMLLVLQISTKYMGGRIFMKADKGCHNLEQLSQHHLASSHF